MVEELVIDFTQGGRAESLHMDHFDLSFLGKMKVSRASEIVYNQKTQSWDIILPGDEEPRSNSVSGFAGYDTARRFEVRWLQECRKAQIDPKWDLGVAVGECIRKLPEFS